MAEIGASLHLLDVRIGGASNPKLVSAKERRRIENLADVLHGKGTGSVSTSSISPSSPRNFFLRKAFGSLTMSTSPSYGNNLMGTHTLATAPDESVRDFSIDSNPNRVFIAGSTLWQQLPNPTNTPGAQTSSNGRFIYVRKNVLLFNDVLLVCNMQEDDDLVGAGPVSAITNSKRGSNSRSSTPLMRDSGTADVHDGTEFGNIDLDDVSDLRTMAKNGSLQMQLVSFVKTMKMFDLPPVTTDRGTWSGNSVGVGATAGAGVSAAQQQRERPSTPAGSESGVSGHDSSRYQYHRMEILYHPANRQLKSAGDSDRHTRSLVLCSQQRGVANKFREELRQTMIAYHVHFQTAVIINHGNNSSSSSSASAYTNDDTSWSIINSSSSALPGSGSANTAPNAGSTSGAIGASSGSFAFILPPSLLANLRLGWLYNIFGGTIFEAAYTGDVRSLRNHLDHMSTFSGNFHSSGGHGDVHSLSPNNINIALTTPGSKGAAGVEGSRARTATVDSVSINNGAGSNYYIDSLDQFGMSALHWACLHGHIICARLLMDFGADVNVRQQRGGNSALHLACACGHVAIVSLLLRKSERSCKGGSCRVEQRNYAGHNAVEMALFYSHIRCQKALHNTNGGSSARNSVIMEEKQRLQGVLAALYSHGANFNEEDSSGNTPLYLCVYFNLKYGVEILMELLGSGATSGTTMGNNKPRGMVDGQSVTDQSNAAERISNTSINVNAVHSQHCCNALQLACVRLADMCRSDTTRGDNAHYVASAEVNTDSIDIIRLLVGGGAFINWRNKNISKIESKSEKRASEASRQDNNSNDSGSRENSRRNSRDSTYSCTGSQLSGAYGSGMIDEASEYNSDEDRESYSYGQGGYDSGRGSIRSKSRDSRGTSRSGSKGGGALRDYNNGNKGGAVGAWTPLQILQRTYVEVKLEEINELNNTNMYSSSASANGNGAGLRLGSAGTVSNAGTGTSTATSTPRRRHEGSHDNTKLGMFNSNTFAFSTPAPVFYRANCGGGNQSPETGTSASSPRLVSGSNGGTGLGGNLYSTDGRSGPSVTSRPRGQSEEEDSSVNGVSPGNAGPMADGYITQQTANLRGPHSESKRVSAVVFKTILVLLKAGARWRQKDLEEATHGLNPMNARNTAGGYGSDKAGGGYSSGGSKGKDASTNKNSKRDPKHYLLLAKPSLKFAIDECQAEWATKAEPPNFEEFVCARQAMGDVLYQLKKHWQSDSDQSFCELCCGTFTSISNRRHHCRCCGALVCDKCSSKRMALAVLPPSSSTVNGNEVNVGVTRERTCDACYNQLSQQAHDTQSNHNRYCVKQLKASAEMLQERLVWFLRTLQGDPNTHTISPASRGRGRGSTSMSHNSPRERRQSHKEKDRAGSRSGRSSRSNSRSRSNANNNGGGGGDVRHSSNDNKLTGASDYSYSSSGSGSDTNATKYPQESCKSSSGVSGVMPPHSTPPKYNRSDRDSSKSKDEATRLLFTPPKHVVSKGGQGHRKSGKDRDSFFGGSDSGRTSVSAASSMFSCPGGSGYRADDGHGPASPVRLSLIENDIGLYKILQHRHLVQQQIEGLMECDFLAQTFLDASHMYQAEADSVLF